MKPVICLLGIILPVFLAAAEPLTPAVDRMLTQIFSLPDAQTDLLKVKLAIDQMVDPSVDVEKSATEINQMLKTFQASFSKDLRPTDQIRSLSAFLYQAGPWNNHQPFRYNFADPLGQDLQTKLLSSYLSTKKGNCISMPVLFVILAGKLGLDVTLSTAPLHVFVQFNDPLTGQYLNIEATDRGQFVPETLYTANAAITPKAIKNAVYFQPLTKKQTVAVIVMLLAEHYEQQRQWQQSIEIAHLVLKYYPKYDYAMIKIGNAYAGLLNDKIAEVKANNSYTLEDKQKMDHFYAQNQHWFAQAEQLGWQPQSSRQDDDYLSGIQQRVQASQP